MSRNYLRAATTSALAALILTGCRTGPKYQRPPAMAQAPPAAYKEAPTQNAGAGAWKVAQPDAATLQAKWWEIYDDAELNSLEDRLNIDNQTLKQYFENFMEARALVAEAHSQLYPTVTFGPSNSHSRSSANQSSTPSASTGNVTSLTSLPFDVSWEPDLWGRIRGEIREAQYNAQVSAADLEGERLSEQASLAVYFYEIRGQDALEAVYRKTVADDQQSLDLTRSQYETGVGTEISVAEAQNTLQNAQAALTALGVARAQYEHAIAVLVGTNPSTFSIPVRALNATPPTVPVGVPSQLLERRPDIAAAERTMASANAAIGVADTAFYPALTLSADGGLESSALKHLFDWPSRFWSVGSSLSQTLYEGGLQRAAAIQYATIYNGDVDSYRQTVLTAFQQVEDALAAVRILSQQMQQQQMAAQTAQQVVDLEMARYRTGVDPYLDVVTVQATLLADQQALTTLHMQAMTASVDLIEALGGGWDSTQLPTPKQVSGKLTAADATIQK